MITAILVCARGEYARRKMPRGSRDRDQPMTGSASLSYEDLNRHHLNPQGKDRSQRKTSLDRGRPRGASRARKDVVLGRTGVLRLS